MNINDVAMRTRTFTKCLDRENVQ